MSRRSHRPLGIGPNPAPHPASVARHSTRDDEPVNLISNAPVIVAPEDDNIPNEHEFQLMRLRRRIADLECTVRDKDLKISQAIQAIDDQLVFWRTYLDDKVGETLGGIMRRVNKLESAIAALKDRQPKTIPPLEIPERWKIKER